MAAQDSVVGLEHIEEEKNKEIASAGRALFLAAFTVIVGSLTFALMIYFLHLSF